MANNDDQEKCPKDGLPPSGNRYSGGVKQLICGNGHNWAEGSGRKSDKARMAGSFEHPDMKYIREQLDKYTFFPK